MDRPRRVAFDAVAAVHHDDAYANLILPRLLRSAGLSGRDAAFATELVYGTLRRRGTLDAVLERAAGRPVEQLDAPVRDALRIGAYQLLYTRVPAHAAVSATVSLVREEAPRAAKFANAVLRRIAEADEAAWRDRVAPPYGDDPVAHLAVVHSHPPWVVRAFAEALGEDLSAVDGPTATAALLAADNAPAPVHLAARPGRTDAEALAAEVGGTRGTYSPYAVVLPGGAPGRVPAVAAGRAHVQDEGSQLVALALAEAPLREVTAAEVPAPDPAPGAAPATDRATEHATEHWLDLCAGPGGKAALLGGLAAQRGADVTAVEVAAHRARLVTEAVAGAPVTVVEADGREVGRPPLSAGSFDRVLVDAPCTGLGALRRRPEARWRRVPGDLPALTRLQRELLIAAVDVVRPGGVVAYVTCSPHRVETVVSLQEARRRSQHPTELLDARALLPAHLPDLGDGPTVQLWPHRHGTDAMFLSVLRRTA